MPLTKCKLSDLPLLILKFTKFVMSSLELRASFSSNFASLISIMRDKSSVHFHLKLYILSKKGTHQSANYQTFNCSHENQATSQFSFKFCIQCHDTKFLWNFPAELLRFGQKESIKVQILRLSCALMKVHPIPHASFETTRSRFIQILHHCSVSWKITPLYFFSSNIYTLEKTQFSDFWMVEWKFKIHQILFVMFETTIQFFFKLCITLQCHERTLLYFFSWNCTWFEEKEPIKVQNFRLSTAHVKFHQIGTLIGPFCWKYIKFQLKV